MAQALLALMGTDALGIVGLTGRRCCPSLLARASCRLLTAIVATGIGDKGTTQLRKAKP
jgi:hypothetical protein